jgi:two-component system alkaline phosphatase synthesis response regulator PhoP
MKKRVLIVENDKVFAALLCENLEYEGFAVEIYEGSAVELPETSTSIESLLKHFPSYIESPDSVLPQGADEPEMRRSAQQQSIRTPILILSARGQKDERNGGLSAGAERHATKPFALDELLARIHAVLRGPKLLLDQLRLGDVVIDFRQLRAVRRNRDINLTDREFEILRILAERKGQVVTRDELLHLVWGYSEAPLTRTVDNFILRLRRKLEPDPRHPTYIRTAYGDGYRLVCS